MNETSTPMQLNSENEISLNETSLAAVFERMDRRLARLEKAVERVDALARGTPSVLATLVDTLDGITARLAGEGVDVDERARGVAKLVEQVTSPRVLHAVTALLDRVDAIETVVRLAEQAPGWVATVTDVVDGATARLADRGVDLDTRARVMLHLFKRLTAPETLAALEKLLDSGLLDARALDSLGRVADALASTGGTAPPPAGAWAAFRALGDADVQRAVGLLLAIAKHLGHSLVTPQELKQLPASTSARRG